MPRSHPFCPRTTTDGSRGSIAVLSATWVAVTACAMLAIGRATTVVHERSALQTSADSIALAVADHGEASALRFAASLNVVILSVDREDNTVTVRVLARDRQAVASAFSPK